VSILRSDIEQLPNLPGVYRMLDAEGTVLYVGKAQNLKKRVSSYFSKNQQSPKTSALVSQIVSIDISVTQSETEALLLESNLIKALSPKYNVLMRDDKSYPYIYLSSNHPFPRMEMVRCKNKPKKGRYFGPFPSSTAVRDTLNLVQKIFKIRSCSDNYFSSRTRPCLQYQIKRCTAPCTGYISNEAYQQSVQDALQLLQGKGAVILKDLSKRMEAAVSGLAFEEAAVLRDQIKSIRLIQETQGVAGLQGEADAIAMDVEAGFACLQCVSIRQGQVIASQSFFPIVPEASLEEDRSLQEQVLEAFIANYYLEKPERIPPKILIETAMPEMMVMENLLTEFRGKRCRLQLGQRGLAKRWLAFARTNLSLSIAQHRRSESMLVARYQALSSFLGRTIRRMECFDISHTQGNETVASCVVFGAEGPSKKDYRQFNIKGITPGDDYAAMEQVLSRRYQRLLEEDKDLPDLVIVDGGKGQVNIAAKVLDQLGVPSALLGIAKGPERKAGLERLILHDQQHALSLPEDSEALHLLQHIRDEAHRFAVTAHRKKRQKSGLRSQLDDIEGVGPKRKKALLQRFGGVNELAKAPVEEIAKVEGVNETLAERIYGYFHHD